MFEKQKEDFELNMVDKRKPYLILDQGSKTMKLAPYKISLSQVCNMDWRRNLPGRLVTRLSWQIQR